MVLLKASGIYGACGRGCGRQGQRGRRRDAAQRNSCRRKYAAVTGDGDRAPVAQARETDPENPAPGVTVTVPVPELPVANTIGLGDTLRLKVFVCAWAVWLAIEKSRIAKKKGISRCDDNSSHSFGPRACSTGKVRLARRNGSPAGRQSSKKCAC